MSRPTNDELEQFRRQWQEEVSERRRRRASKETGVEPSTSGSVQFAAPTSPTTSRPKVPNLTSTNKDNYQDTYVRGTYDFDDLEAREDARRLGVSGTGVHPEAIASTAQPQTALEHFERAVEREAQGNLQESLIHYRRAYKLDDRVDQVYRNKHFPPPKFKSKAIAGAHPAGSSVGTAVGTSVDVGNSTGHDALSELISSFADSTIEATVPEVEGAPRRPCHLASLPPEILAAVLDQVALTDVAALMRLSYVCKRLAYLTHVDDRLWRSVCRDSRFGWRDMHYAFALTLRWRELPRPLLLDDPLVPDMEALSLSSPLSAPDAIITATAKPFSRSTFPLLPTLTPQYPTFLHTFHARPRIRFCGVYISTISYVRAGASSANSVYWGNSPVHMVTYYRYLRFYRDGSAIFLLSTYDPHDVVPLLHKRHVLGTDPHERGAGGGARERLPNVTASALAGAGAGGANIATSGSTSLPTAASGPNQPSTVAAVMKDARKARWRMSLLHDGGSGGVGGSSVGGGPEGDNKKTSSSSSSFPPQPLATDDEPEGNLYVESEGATNRYEYHLQLALRSVRATGVALNTKLQWRSFWSHNLITDDWAEFNLKNDTKVFVFSRVKSWVDA